MFVAKERFNDGEIRGRIAMPLLRNRAEGTGETTPLIDIRQPLPVQSTVKEKPTTPARQTAPGSRAAILAAAGKSEPLIRTDVGIRIQLHISGKQPLRVGLPDMPTYSPTTESGLPIGPIDIATQESREHADQMITAKTILNTEGPLAAAASKQSIQTGSRIFVTDPEGAMAYQLASQTDLRLSPEAPLPRSKVYDLFVAKPRRAVYRLEKMRAQAA